MLTLRHFAIAAAVVVLGVMVTRCVSTQRSKVQANAAVYQAACAGPPLGTLAKRSAAMDEGYFINKQFDCIDKASFAAVTEQEAKWAASHSPQAQAKAAAERKLAFDKAQQLQQAADDAYDASVPPFDPSTIVPLAMVEANTASEAQLAEVYGMTPAVAGHIVYARKLGPYADWPDLVERVFKLHPGKSAAEASVAGLTVNGHSMPAIPADAATVALAKYNAKFRRR